MLRLLFWKLKLVIGKSGFPTISGLWESIMPESIIKMNQLCFQFMGSSLVPLYCNLRCVVEQFLPVNLYDDQGKHIGNVVFIENTRFSF